MSVHRWVEHHYGNTWVGKNIEGFINIGGPLLGVPKTLSAVLSGMFPLESRPIFRFGGAYAYSIIGEMRDTAELNPAMQFIKENLLSRNDMVNMFRYFFSLFNLGGGTRSHTRTVQVLLCLLLICIVGHLEVFQLCYQKEEPVFG